MFRKMIAVVLAAMLITSAAPLSAFAAETEPDNGTVAAAETSELPTETEPAVAEPTEAVTIPPVQEKAAEKTEEVITQPVQEKKAEPVGASVDTDQTVGKSSFTYTVSNDQVTITGLSDEYLTDLVIPDTIEGLPVTAIKENAFNGCSQITSITVPNSVTSIGDGAFRGTNPTKVTLPFIGGSRSATNESGVFGYVFGTGAYSDTGVTHQYKYYFIPKTIKEVVITDDVRIPAYAFYNCSWIESIKVNQQIETIGNYGFCNCSSLSGFEIPDSVTSIGTYAFNNCSSLTEISISDNISVLSDAVLGGCNKLESFNFPTSLTQIGASAFYNCSSLGKADLVIPDGVTSIGSNAFYGCGTITSIMVPNSVTSIGDGAFRGTNPTKVTLPFIGGSRSATNESGVFGYVFGTGAYSDTGVTHQYKYYFIPKTIKEVVITDDVRIPAYAFYNCSWIESIKVNQQIETIGNYGFCNCSSLSGFEIPDSVTSIGTYAFNNCSSLTEVNISDNISVLSDAVFGGCNKLESFNFPTSLTQIGASAFYNCSSLGKADLVIPDGVTSIGSNAFYGCGTITSIAVPNSVTSIGDGAFRGTNPTKVTLPFIGGSRSATNESGVFGYVFGTGAYSDTGVTHQYKYYFIPKTIKEVVITDDVRIPAYAFYNCSWIEKVTINDIEGDASVVGNNAFYNCPAMTVYVNRNTGVHTYCERNGIKHCSTKSISLDSDSLVLFRNESNTIGSEVILLNGKVDDDPETVWTSSDTDVVTVNRNTGLITAVAPGTATVAADSEGVTATAEVTVYFKIEGIALNKSTTEIDINKTETLTVTYSPENTTDNRKITWTSSDDKIAQVDENGTVTALKRGKATITATAINGAEAKCTVQVLVPITGITFESDTVSIPRSTRQKVPFTLSPEDYTDTYTVTSSDTEIATVDKFGNVVAKKVGTAVITVTTSRGLEKSCTVKVYSPATAVTLSADSKTIFANRSFELKADLSPSDCTDSITWSSSDDRIATVDKDGVVTGVSKGFATITATADSGKSADCVVTVESDVNAATVYLEYNETEYNAEEKTPEVFVYFNDERLVEDADYSLYYYNNHDAGKAGVIVTSLYDGTEVDKAFVIHPLTVTAMEISCQQTMTYTGSELKGVEDVTYQSLRLAEGVDYELKYDNNTNVGKATATITGKGNFTGVTTATFTILPRPISEMTVLLESSSYRYDGTEKMPAVTVRYGAKELEEDEDYRVEYTDNLNAGDARVTISGMGNYSGYVEKPFRIEAKSISEAKLFLEETVYLCDGAEKCPRVTVTDGETELKKGTDYDVAYKNNTDVGIATVMISGKGNYSGSVSETFEIIMLGDVNADGRVDINDATLVQKAVAELVVLDEKQQKAADVTGDGKITIDDATLIQKYVAELIDHFG